MLAISLVCMYVYTSVTTSDYVSVMYYASSEFIKPKISDLVWVSECVGFKWGKYVAGSRSEHPNIQARELLRWHSNLQYAAHFRGLLYRQMLNQLKADLHCLHCIPQPELDIE